MKGETNMKNKNNKHALAAMKESGIKSLSNQATLETWDGKSSIWAYCYTTDETREITNQKKIYQLLSKQQPCMYFFLTFEDMEDYRKLFNYIDSEVNRRINEGIMQDYADFQRK